MIAPGLLNESLPVRSPDKIKGADKGTGAGAAKPQDDKAGDFQSLMEQRNAPEADKPQADDDDVSLPDDENISEVPDHFSAALLFPVMAAPETDDDVSMEKISSAAVSDEMENAGQADRSAGTRSVDISLTEAQNTDGEKRLDKAGQPLQKEEASSHAVEKAVADVSRKGSDAGDMAGASGGKGRDGAAADDTRRQSVSETAGRQAAGQDQAAPRFHTADLSVPAATADSVEKLARLEVGDKILLKAPVAENTMLARIEAVEVLSSRSNGDMRQLHLKLTPENLGTVEARLRLHEGGLNVELRAAQADTARFLARDHEMLVSLLERSGFKDHSRVSVTISDQSGTVSHRVAITAQLAGEQSAGQNGQDARAGMQNSGQNGRGSNRQNDENAAAYAHHNGQQPDEGDKESHARRTIRGLVV